MSLAEQKRIVVERESFSKRWAGARCYLNGQPAIISGYGKKFATISTTLGPRYSVEFSWQAVNATMYGKMEFFT